MNRQSSCRSDGNDDPADLSGGESDSRVLNIHETFNNDGVAVVFLNQIGNGVAVAAGSKILPSRFRSSRYKPWMRAALILWLITLFSEMASYVQWYGLPHLSAVGCLLKTRVSL
jgi:hypothetical protein